MIDRVELIEKLERNARSYENEAKAMKPEGARHLGPSESACIGEMLREAASALKEVAPA
jgi:hypothetical protein